MNMTAFLRGVCVGMVAGAAADMAAHPYPKARKTAVGKAMQRMGNALDSALVTVTSMLTEVSHRQAAEGNAPSAAALCKKSGVFREFYLDKAAFFVIIVSAVRRRTEYMQWYRRGHNEHDWKSCCRQKRHEGSNPSHCARKA